MLELHYIMVNLILWFSSVESGIFLPPGRIWMVFYLVELRNNLIISAYIQKIDQKCSEWNGWNFNVDFFSPLNVKVELFFLPEHAVENVGKRLNGRNNFQSLPTRLMVAYNGWVNILFTHLLFKTFDSNSALFNINNLGLYTLLFLFTRLAQFLTTFNFFEIWTSNFSWWSIVSEWVSIKINCQFASIKIHFDLISFLPIPTFISKFWASSCAKRNKK